MYIQIGNIMYINELKKKNVVVKSDNRFIFLFNIIVKL